MKVRVRLRFRARQQDVRPLVPADLAFLQPAIREYEPGSGFSRAEVVLSPETAGLVIEWSRTGYRGKSVARFVDLYEEYALADLNGVEIVEIFRPLGSGEPRSVRNFKQAYRMTWACDHCHRVERMQAAPLDVGTGRTPQALLTRTEEWIVPASVVEALQQSDVSWRPLAGTDRFVQLVTGAECHVLADAEALREGEPCPGCGRRPHWRLSLVEGDPVRDSFSGLTFYRHEPHLTITSSSVAGLTLARGDITFPGQSGYAPKPVHRIGDPSPVDEFHFCGLGEPCFFARADLVRTLLDAGVAGIAFRPVRLR